MTYASTCFCSTFFFQAKAGIRYYKVTGVQTCALPISHAPPERRQDGVAQAADPRRRRDLVQSIERQQEAARPEPRRRVARPRRAHRERQRPPEKRDPSKPGAHRTADAETTDDEPDAGA